MMMIKNHLSSLRLTFNESGGTQNDDDIVLDKLWSPSLLRNAHGF